MHTMIPKQLTDPLALLHTRTSRTAVQGTLVASTAVIIATLLAAYVQTGGISLGSISTAQSSNSALWLLDLMPFAFAFWGQYVSNLVTREAGNAVIDHTHALWEQNQAMYARLQSQMESDAITGLANRTSFRAHLSHHIESADQKTCFAIVALGIDSLRDVHQAIGFDKAEKLLRHVADKLSKVFTTGFILARTSYDEFSVLIPDACKRAHVTTQARAMRGVLSEPFVVDGLTLIIESSIGASFFAKDSGDPEMLMRFAEAAMYVNRTESNEITFYSPDFEQSRLTELTMKAEFMQAISEGHLVLHYQPKIDRDFRVYEAEALIRWHHPEKGLVPPDQFVPFVERNGLNRELMQWVLGKAIAQVAVWQRQGIDIGVCINLSMLDLMDLELPNMLADVLRRTSVSPARIKLELTETMIMADHHRAIEVLAAITEMGILTSIDDFGTGYASLSYLRQLPSRELKIDKTFVTDMIDNEHNAIIVQTIINLAHNLSMNVVAEGVESESVLHRLLDFGCDAMQGYHISRPMEASQLGPWLHSWDEQHGLTHEVKLDLAV